jgi:hypothetical protein
MRNKVCAVVLLVWFGVALSACAGPDRHRFNTQRGAIVGAGLGALAGQAIGKNTESTLLGTALGGLTGAVIGNYHDQLYGAGYLRYSPQRAWVAPQVPATAYRRPPQTGNWVTVPAQSVGGQYVPAHNVWIPRADAVVPVSR